MKRKLLRKRTQKKRIKNTLRRSQRSRRRNTSKIIRTKKRLRTNKRIINKRIINKKYKRSSKKKVGKQRGGVLPRSELDKSEIEFLDTILRYKLVSVRMKSTEDGNPEYSVSFNEIDDKNVTYYTLVVTVEDMNSSSESELTYYIKRRYSKLLEFYYSPTIQYYIGLYYLLHDFPRRTLFNLDHRGQIQRAKQLERFFDYFSLFLKNDHQSIDFLSKPDYNIFTPGARYPDRSYKDEIKEAMKQWRESTPEHPGEGRATHSAGKKVKSSQLANSGRARATPRARPILDVTTDPAAPPILDETTEPAAPPEPAPPAPATPVPIVGEDLVDDIISENLEMLSSAILLLHNEDFTYFIPQIKAEAIGENFNEKEAKPENWLNYGIIYNAFNRTIFNMVVDPVQDNFLRTFTRAIYFVTGLLPYIGNWHPHILDSLKYSWIYESGQSKPTQSKKNIFFRFNDLEHVYAKHLYPTGFSDDLSVGDYTKLFNATNVKWEATHKMVIGEYYKKVSNKKYQVYGISFIPFELNYSIFRQVVSFLFDERKDTYNPERDESRTAMAENLLDQYYVLRYISDYEKGNIQPSKIPGKHNHLIYINTKNGIIHRSLLFHLAVELKSYKISGEEDHNINRLHNGFNVKEFIEEKLSEILLPARKFMLSVILTNPEYSVRTLGIPRYTLTKPDSIYIPEPKILVTKNIRETLRARGLEEYID